MSAKKWLFLVIFGYVLVMGAMVILRQQQFKTQTWDMAIFDQTMWNTVHGRWMQNSIEEVSNHLGVHLSPLLFILAPGYALFPSPYFLLIIQVVALALGAWPLFLFASRYLKEKIAFFISLGYLLYPSLHTVNLFDFHPIAFLIPALLAGFYFLEIKRWLLAAVFLILAASAQEDAVLAVMFVGLFYLIKSVEFKSLKNIFKRDWWIAERRAGLAIFFLSLVYFVIAVKVLMPMFGGGLLRADRYVQLGADFGEMARNIFVHPQIYIDTIFTKVKAIYLFWLFAPLLFLPLFSWRVIILLAPGLLENLLTNYSAQFSGGYQYDSILIPGLFIAAIINLSKYLDKQNTSLKDIKKEQTAVWVVVAAFALIFVLRSPLASRSLWIDLTGLSDQEKVYSYMVKTVPDAVSVAAHTRMTPHLSQREMVTMIGFENGLADVALVDGADTFGFAGQEGLQNYVDGYIDTNLYAVNIIDDRYFIIYRKDLVLNEVEYE